jgi:dTDP-4-dehydrorhamnose reductase
MKIMLTGASGLLGRAFVRRLEGECELYATAFSRTLPPLQKLDLRDDAAVKALVQEFRPELIIHSAAERRPDICENDHTATDALNVAAVKVLADAATDAGAMLLYLSTDYVFDGTAPPYTTDAEPNPLNYYGKSKRAGEIAALESGARVCVLRVPILYGPVESIDESAVTTLARLLESKDEVLVDHWAIRYPTHVDDVAEAVADLIELLEKNESIPEILHFSGAEAFTKYEMVVAMAEACGRDASHLKADPSVSAGAPRPHNCQLDDSLLMDLVQVEKKSFRDAIGRLVDAHLDVG